MIGVDILGWLAAIVGSLVAALAVKSRNQYRDKAKQSESRVEAVIEKRKTEHEVEKLDGAGVAAEFDWLRAAKDKKRR